MQYSEDVLKRARMAVEFCNAILEGKEIQYRDNTGTWDKAKTPCLSLDKYEYRVKPEPKYIPFTFEDAKDLIGKAVVKKGVTLVLQIIAVTNNEVGFDSNNVSFQYLLESYTFLDGTPCGKIQNT